MTILHYISNSKSAKAQNYVSMLQASMGKALKMSIISGSINRKSFLRQLAIINPDIVHIHGCWQHKASLVQKWCSHRGYPVIISPHGQLSMEIISTNPWKYYVPRIIAYQFRSIHSCYLLLATSQKELADLKELGWRKRLLLASTSDPKLSDTLYAIYKKVIDTNQRNHLSVSDSSSLYFFLNAAANADHDNQSIITLSGTKYNQKNISTPLPDGKDRADISNLSASSWQAIQVYAIDHAITDILQKGVKALNITIPQIVTTPPDRFAYHTSLKIRKGISRENISERYPNNLFEVDIAMNIITLYAMIVNNRKPADDTPSPLHLLYDIHQAIRWKDYDESVLMSILGSIGMKTFTARLMYILSEAFHLSLGYMPIDPVNDHTTQQLTIKLNSLP